MYRSVKFGIGAALTCVTRHEKQGLCTQNTPIHIIVCIFYTV